MSGDIKHSATSNNAHDDLIRVAQEILTKHGVMLHEVSFHWLSLEGIDTPNAALCDCVSVRSSKKWAT
jgi:hypothetical protein